jgi:uncharacterized protein YyaL (SSP411 family)
MTSLLSTRLSLDHPLSIIVITDKNANKDDTEDAAHALAHAALAHPIFCRQVIIITPDCADIDTRHPAYSKHMLGDKATAYICPGQSCLAPITEADAVTAALDALLHRRQTLASD